MPLVVPMQITTVTGVQFPLIAAVDEMSVDRLKQGLPQQVPATQGETVGTTITVVSQTGPQGPGGGSGTPGAGGAGANVPVDFGGLYSTDVTAETILDPGRLAQLGTLGAGTLTVSFTGRGSATGGATGTFKLRLGGTDGGVDGTVLATLTVTGSSLTTYTATATLYNPMGAQVLKLTGASSVNGLDVVLESVVCVFTRS